MQFYYIYSYKFCYETMLNPWGLETGISVEKIAKNPWLSPPVKPY